MNPKLHVRQDDVVEVTTGEYKGARGRVLEALPRKGKVVVENVNVAWKHIRPSQQNPRGGRVEREAPIDASNVRLLCQNRDCSRHDRPVRTRTRVNPDGTKNRLCVRCGQPITTSE